MEVANGSAVGQNETASTDSFSHTTERTDRRQEQDNQHETC
jgi:hypothetical protein